MRILIAGDFSQKNRLDAVVRNRDFGRLFDEIVPIVTGADYSIVNFEFPIILEETRSRRIPKVGPHLQGTIEAVEAVKYAGFKCCTLANNHILDQGEMCCLDTVASLEEAGIDTVGAGESIEEAGKVLYKNVASEKIAVINCCESEFSIATRDSAGANPFSPIRLYYDIREARKHADYVIIIIHGGHEHYQLPSPRMQEQYRFLVDAGADAVVNGHQHCYSGFEIYQGRPIIYGLGNFCFDNPQKKRDKWNEGYMVMLRLEKGRVGIDRLVPYSQCDTALGVHPIADETSFTNNIRELNRIISSKELLAEYAEDFYSNTSSQYLEIYEPYHNRVFKKLFSLGLLPSFLSTKKLLPIRNYTECESHRDRLLYALHFFINKQYEKKP